METVQKDIAVPGLTIRAGTPMRVVAENMRDLIAENNDLASISTESKLYRAVLALSAQSGTPADEIVKWLCDGGLAQMALSHFAAAQSHPLVEPTADISGTPPGEWGGLSPKQAWWAGYRVGKGLPADMKRSDAVSADPGYDLWQPIETAPRSGLPFLAVCARYGSVFMAHWANGVVDSCVQADEGYEDRPAKFWMPLPASPQHQVKKGEPS